MLSNSLSRIHHNMLIATIFSGIIKITSSQSLNATHLHRDRLACPGQQIIFTCETRGSSVIAWKSDEFIGPGGSQLQFTQSHDIYVQDRSGDTVATLVGNRVEGEERVLVSVLNITASSMYPNPSVTCIDVDSDRYNTTTFQMIAGPKAPQDVVAVQIEHTTGNCVGTALWYNPDNEFALLNHYIATLNSVHEHTIPASSMNSTRFSTVFSVPTCGSNSISVKAVGICGRESPSRNVTLNKGSCFLAQDSVCFAPTATTLAATVSSTSEISTTAADSNSAVNKPLQDFSTVLNVVVIIAAVLHYCVIAEGP